MIRVLAFAAAMIAATPALAVTQWVAQPDPKTISWEGTQGGNKLAGHCEKFTADIAFDPAALANSAVKVTIDTGSCKTGEAQKDEYLPQAGWFNVTAFPNAVFEAKRFRHDGGDRYAADGTLTLKGVTKQVALLFTLKIDGDKAHVVGVTTLQRLAFGVGDGSQLSSADVAGLDVKVKVDLHATKK
ncbi:MAG TPA: YceI family protein [Parvibaculum sp.]|jgi:polyisoprenoid-binding protein YceI